MIFGPNRSRRRDQKFEKLSNERRQYRGIVVDMGKKVGEAKTNKWLHALAIKQPGQSDFVEVDPEGCWMPFAIQRFVLEEVR